MFNSEIYYFSCIIQEYYISHSNIGYAINCIYNYCIGQVGPTDFFHYTFGILQKKQIEKTGNFIISY